MTASYDEDRFAIELAGVFLKERNQLVEDRLKLLNFSIGAGNRLHISWNELKKIARLIEARKIRIVVDDAYVDAQGADAIYDWKNTSEKRNRIVVRRDWIVDAAERSRTAEIQQKYALDPPLNPKVPSTTVFDATPMREAKLVHEATHALLDMRGLVVRRLWNEIAAWLASVVYLYHIGAIGHAITGNKDFEQILWSAADAVARKQRLYFFPGARLFRADLQPLLDNVRKKYGLSASLPTALDGID